MDERLDVLTPSGEKTGRVEWRSEAHRLGLWHRCFHCWITAPIDASGGPYLFLQRRAAGKETWPGKLDATAAGHLGAGESTFDGLRELEEELGLRAAPNDLVPLGTRKIEKKIPAGVDRELQEVFLLARPLSPEDLELREEEVAAVARLRLGDVEDLCGGATVFAEEWGGTRLARDVPVCPDDLVPGDEDYLLRVARAARAVLDGGRPGAVF